MFISFICKIIYLIFNNGCYQPAKFLKIYRWLLHTDSNALLKGRYYSHQKQSSENDSFIAGLLLDLIFGPHNNYNHNNSGEKACQLHI